MEEGGRDGGRADGLPVDSIAWIHSWTTFGTSASSIIAKVVRSTPNTTRGKGLASIIHSRRLNCITPTQSITIRGCLQEKSLGNFRPN